MKRNNVFQVTLLSYFVLTIRGKELKCINNGENSSQILVGQQVNRAIQGAIDDDLKPIAAAAVITLTVVDARNLTSCRRCSSRAFRQHSPDSRW
uniref:Uncharacterized protein n=1 Tax=Oryza glaberrima TaxID=4538 RepID=I1P553_ORYGL